MDLFAFFVMRWALYTGEILIAGFPFLFKRKRRKLFYVRLFVSIAVLVGFVFIISSVNIALFNGLGYESSVKVGTSLLGYFVFAALVFGMSCFLFAEPPLTLFSCFVQGYGVRSLCFAVYILLIAIIGQEWNFLAITGATSFVNFLIYFAVYAHVFALYMLLCGKYVFHSENTLPKRLLPAFVIVLTLLVCLHSFGELFNENDKTLYILLLCSEITSYIVLFVSDYLLRKNDQLQTENQVVASLLQEQGRQFKFSKANAEDLRMKAHDLKHQIAILRQGGEEAEKLLRSLEEDVDDFESTIYLDNQVLNITLREKWGYCKKHRIRLTYASDPNAFAHLSAVDLFTLCGNILDNAIEATMKLSNKSKRVISVAITHRNGLSCLRCDNFFEGQLREEKGKFITNKGDAFSHGFGIASIRRIALTYDGAVDIKHGNGIYVIKVSIPDPEPTETDNKEN